LQSLYFLLPLLVIYEIGAVMVLDTTRLTATRLLDQFFALFGVTGVHLPAIAVVAALLGMHMTRRRDPWSPEPKLYLVMLIESAVLAVPLFVLATVLVREPLVGASLSSIDWENWRQKMVIAIGAGVYEELLFRLVGLALIHALMKDLLSLPEDASTLSPQAVTLIGFVLIHFAGYAHTSPLTKMLF